MSGPRLYVGQTRHCYCQHRECGQGPTLEILEHCFSLLQLLVNNEVNNSVLAMLLLCVSSEKSNAQSITAKGATYTEVWDEEGLLKWLLLDRP